MSVPPRPAVVHRWSCEVAIAALAALTACGDEATVSGLDRGGEFTVEVTIRLDPPREPFKVDGRLEASYDLAPPFEGETEVGVIVLPAGRAAVKAPLLLPAQSGRLELREITFSPAVPFLCGRSPPLDPRVDRVTEIGVRLCIP
ncbi:MAG: hypothetical protein ACREMD_06070 [Gemmatimonadota bacterium]